MATQIVEKELWKNVAPGLRYYITIDALGNKSHNVVQPGRTFSISPTERRLNQDAAYETKADLFRNGTFVMLKETDDTVTDEIESPNSISDGEIETAAAEALGGDTVPYEAMLARTSSAVTAQRILEEAVLQDLPTSLVQAAKDKVEEFAERPIGPDGKPMQIVERETMAAPEIDPEGFRASKAQRPR